MKNIESMRSRIIVVLGMHRSGSSVITRGLQILGVELGDRLNPAIEHINPKGFWEDLDVMALNTDALNALNTDWHMLTDINDAEVEFLRDRGFIDRAIELLRHKTQRTSIYGFKDPLTIKLLLFWREVFGRCQFNVSYVLTMRHPLSIATSLVKLKGFDIEKSYLLWAGHAISCLKNTNGEKRVLVDYDRLMRMPEHELNRIASAMDLDIDPKKLRYYKTDFLDQELQHTVFNLKDLQSDNACPSIVREIYSALYDVASNKRLIDDAMLQHQTALWAKEHERSKSAFMLVDKQFMRIVERDAQIAGLNAEIEQLKQAIVLTTEQFRKSRSWRITAPFRSASRLFSKRRES